MKPGKNQRRNTDTGLALTLIVLITAWFFNQIVLILPAIGLLLLAMVWPPAFKPLAPLWFGLAHFMGGLVSKILLSLVFIFIVTPVGLLRRISGKDPMRLKLWKQDSGSVFLERNHIYELKNLEKPF